MRDSASGEGVAITSRPFVKPLTSLRFFAAWLVVCHHFFDFDAGYAGVTFFFVLSGFILALNYAGRVNTPIQRRKFWLKRFARIYPAHLLTFVAAIPLVIDQTAAAFGLEAIANLMLLHSMIPSWSLWFSFNAVSWSISTEAFFYAFFPLLSRWIAIKPGIKLATGGLALLCVAITWNSVRGNPGFDDGPTRFLFYVAPFLRIFEFALGIGLALQLATSRMRVGFALEVAAMLFAIGSLALVPLGLPGAYSASIIFIPASALIVAVFARSDGPIAKLLSSEPLVLLGNASFMLYMTHWLCREYLVERIGTWPTVAFSVLLSVALYWWFEKPVHRWALGRMARKDSATAC